MENSILPNKQRLSMQELDALAQVLVAKDKDIKKHVKVCIFSLATGNWLLFLLKIETIKKHIKVQTFSLGTVNCFLKDKGIKKHIKVWIFLLD